MSRDNGMYILQSPKPGVDPLTGLKEYRVALTTNIENIDIYEKHTPGKPLERGIICEAAIFGDCEVYDDANMAIAIACAKVATFEKEDGYIEYGIVVIPRQHPFPTLPTEKAKQLLGWGWLST